MNSFNYTKVEGDFDTSNSRNCLEMPNGLIATQSEHASEAGAEMLRSGGNAIDAAISAALALGVTESQASGLGGQTMMLIHTPDGAIAVDGSSRAPSLAHVGAIYKSDRTLGYRAATVPSTPAVLWYVHDRYGELPWQQVMEPAIMLAKNGYPITELQSRLQKRETAHFLEVGSRSGARYFLKNGLQPYAPGDIFKQDDLSRCLMKLSEKGIDEFYRGTIARQIDADMRENGGLVRLDDLALIPLPIEREPISRPFRDVIVCTMPPPGSGRTLLFALMMLDMVPKDILLENDSESIILLMHILRKAFLERSDRPFDANFFPQTEEDQDMLDSSYARECVLEILGNINSSILPLIPSEDEITGETTHLSVMDNKGYGVALTQSVERVYGSKAAAAELGFLYNNYLYDFDYNQPHHPFYLRPNASPWATVAPTLVYHNDELWMSLGSPGSERIISTIAVVLTSMIDRNMSLSEAMKQPRIHCSLGGRVSLEAEGFSEELFKELKNHKFRIDKREPLSFYLGCLQGVLKKHDNTGYQGVADIRRDGSVQGW